MRSRDTHQQQRLGAEQHGQEDDVLRRDALALDVADDGVRSARGPHGENDDVHGDERADAGQKLAL